MIAEEAADPPTLTRRITIFAAGPDGCYQRHDEHHQLRLLARPHAEAILLAAGFEVSVRPGYQRFSLTGELPGWYVIDARKPASGTVICQTPAAGTTASRGSAVNRTEATPPKPHGCAQ